jgi:hypothetical protein
MTEEMVPGTPPEPPAQGSPGGSPYDEWNAWYAWYYGQTAPWPTYGWPGGDAPPWPGAAGATAVGPSGGPWEAVVRAARPAAQAVDLAAPYPERSSRIQALGGLLFVKPLIALPHLVILVFLDIAAWVVFLCAQFPVMFVARYPRGMHAFITGVLRWNFRVAAFLLGLTDRYPPFTLAAAPRCDYPVDLAVERPDRSNRIWAINVLLMMVSVAIWIDVSAAVWLQTRTVVTLPHLLVLVPLWVAAVFAWWLAQCAVVVRGVYPRGLYDVVAGTLRWSARVVAFWFGLQDKYPAFQMAMGMPSATPRTAEHEALSASTSATPPPLPPGTASAAANGLPPRV